MLINDSAKLAVGALSSQRTRSFLTALGIAVGIASVVLLTSNATRELSEALKRRCLYLYIDFPDATREREILASRVPQLPDAIAREMIRIVGVLRSLDLSKTQ